MYANINAYIFVILYRYFFLIRAPSISVFKNAICAHVLNLEQKIGNDILLLKLQVYGSGSKRHKLGMHLQKSKY